MRNLRRVQAFLVALLMSIMLFAVPVLAATVTQDDLEVTLTTDKEEYAKGEQIVVTLEVTNTNMEAVTNVSMESFLPEGYELAAGNEAVKQLERLEAGESASLVVTYVAKEDGKPSLDDGEAAETGESAGGMIWAILVVLSGAGIVAVLILRRKEGKKFVALLLSFVMVGVLLPGKSVSVQAAEAVENRTINVSETVGVEDAEVQLLARIVYESITITDDDNEELGDVGEISYREPSDDHIVYDEPTNQYYVDNELLITGMENVSREEMEQIIASINGVIVGCIEITNDYQVEIPGRKTLVELKNIVNELNQNEALENVEIHSFWEHEYDYIPNDKKWKNEEWSEDYPEGINWGVEAIRATNAWDYADKMSYVKVGVIDGAFDTQHEDLVYTRVWNNPFNLNSILDEGERAHGTHVSGTLAAGFNNKKGITGVAPKVVLYGFSMFGTNTDAVVVSKNLSSAMVWKYALANLILSGCKVVNVSMGGDHTRDESIAEGEVLGEFLSKLLNKGYEFLIVQSAGNYSKNGNGKAAFENGLFCAITIPAVKNRVMVVGAMGTNKSHKNKGGLFGWFGERVFDGYYIPEFTGVGDRVDVVAPGVDVYSTVLDNKYSDKIFINSHQYIPWSGTSMAAPHVSGIAAACFSVNSSLTGEEVKQIIVKTASRTVTDACHGAANKTYKIPDAGQAVKKALETQGGYQPVIGSNSSGIIMGNIRGYDSTNNAVALEDVCISAYKVSASDQNEIDPVAFTQTDDEGDYELVLDEGRYYINIYIEGYTPWAIGDVNVTKDTITYLDNVILIPDLGNQTGALLSGTVRNALTNECIDGATVKLRAGWNNRYGEIVKDTVMNNDAVLTSDENGNYSTHLIEGCYTAEVSKEGYITSYANVVCNFAFTVSQDVVLTPSLSENEYRIVLTWGSSPSDLDSHLTGPSSGEGRFHVYFQNMSVTDNGNIVAKLDRDDRDCYGPETLTLNKTQDGIYRYSVHDYTNKSSTTSKELSVSGAKVQIYSGNDLVATYTVPYNKVGTVWNVFEIEGDVLRGINTLENITSPGDVARNSEMIAAFSLEEEDLGKENETMIESSTEEVEEILKEEMD